jgi:hypothetical protein
MARRFFALPLLAAQLVSALAVAAFFEPFSLCKLCRLFTAGVGWSVVGWSVVGWSEVAFDS